MGHILTLWQHNVNLQTVFIKQLCYSLQQEQLHYPLGITASEVALGGVEHYKLPI